MNHPSRPPRMRPPATGSLSPTTTPQRELQRVFAEASRAAAPSEADRERITEALRARLGPAVLPEGFLPAVRGSGGVVPRSNGVAAAARAGLGKAGWLGVVVGTGVVAGALGFVLGYGMALRAPGEAPDGAPAVAERSEAPPAAALPGLSSSAAEPASLERASSIAAAEEALAKEALAEEALAEETAAPVESARAARERRQQERERAARRTPAAPLERASPVEPEPARLSFGEVLERLQRANVALRQGQASLALIQLSELDRRGGDVLREEREVTRALASCAIGDVAGARRAAASLLAGPASSIYAPRLDASCARLGGS